MPRIKSAVRRDDTLIRYAGIGDGLTMTWAADDRQLVVLDDGIGYGPNWLDMRPEEGVWNSQLLAVRGGPRDAVFESVSGYPRLITSDKPDQQQRYYGFGTLALDGHIYQYLRRRDTRAWSRGRPFGHPGHAG